jgi:hypothetical protein
MIDVAWLSFHASTHGVTKTICSVFHWYK